MSLAFKLRFAKHEDTKDIMSFIGNHWEKNHILSIDQGFFNFQYWQKCNLQFILALCSNDRIVGILGYIQYDPKKENQNIALALWKVIHNLSDPFLGIKLIQYLRNNIKHKNIFCVGVNKKTTDVYKFLGFQIGKLEHFAAFNKKCKKFTISVPPLDKKTFFYNNEWFFNIVKPTSKLLEKIIKKTEYMKKNHYKSKKYILKRYLNHPYFFYNFHNVYIGDFYLGLIISREVEYLKNKALRIIDVLAEDKYISKMINEFVRILYQSDCEYEYIDVYASNLDKDLLINGNYDLVSDSSEIIVPDHFSPFEKKNIDIYFATTSDQSTIFFKGDGDQDNPRNILLKDEFNE